MSFNSRTKSLYDSRNRLLAFESGVRLASDICGSATSLAEEAGEDRLQDRPEDDLGTIGHWKGHPQNQDELENVVEGEPVDGINHALENSEEGIDDPVRQPLGIINFAGTEQCFQRIVSWNYESCEVYKKFASNVEEDEEEVQADKAQEGVDLGDIGLSLEIVEGRVLGELLIDLRDLVLGLILERHFGNGDGVRDGMSIGSNVHRKRTA